MLKLSSLIMVSLLFCQPALATVPDLPGVDLKDLDADESQILVNVLKKQFDPCGKPRSFLDAIKDPATCKVAPKLANFCVQQIARGLSERQVRKALIKEQKRLTRRHSFTVRWRPVTGPKTAKVTIVEFYDFQCPYCKEAAARVGALLKRFKDVRLVHKQYPLSFHPAAKAAAVAAVAVNAQGKFEALHKRFFADQSKLTDAYVTEVVASLGLDKKRYAVDRLAAEKIVAQDRAEGDAAGLEGTPTFFVNGLMVDIEGLEAAVNEALAK